MIEISGVTKRFYMRRDAVVAVDHVTFKVEKGTFFTLLGPSGCGKSTLLRCVAGLESPDFGKISIGSRLVFSSADGIDVPASRRRIGMVFQSYAVWPHMTVYQNVAFPLEVRGERNVKDRVMRALAMVDLEAQANRYASKLSGGQQQRVALARAIVAEPDLLLLDEPLSNLDAALRDQMRGELRTLQQRLDVTTLYVTHDQTEALSMSDCIAVMRNGRFVEVGRPEDLYHRPKTAFAAQFIGGANMLAGVAKERSEAGGPTVIMTSAGEFWSRDGGRPGPVMLFIRPEKVRVVSGGADGGTANLFACRIKSRRFAGDSIELEVVVGEGSHELALRCKQAEAVDLVPGQTTRLFVDPADVRILESS